MHKKVALKEC